MAATLTASIKGTISHTHTSILNASSPVESLSMVLTNSFASGTGVNKANLVWTDLRSIVTASSEYIDLFDLAISGGAAQLDGLGLAFASLSLKGLAIQIVDSAGAQITTPTAGESLKVGGEGSAAAFQTMFHVSGTLSDTAGIVIAPGGAMMIFAPSAIGYVIVDTSNHLLKIANAGAATIYYKIWILGATAGS